ncbi:hypothetical protein MKW92_047579 [Papaver armeniacum]|nr:hypothetical protein MKW92_047579 [Papaver armeniacum]
MKRIDILCASQASKTICSSMDHQSVVRHHTDGNIVGNSRAIDRHNPHLRDTIRRSREGLLNNNDTNIINPSSSSFSASTYHSLPKKLTKSKSKTKSKPYHNKENQEKKTRCAGKVRKHISRMEGVTSFSIDFPSKKVTVIGNVTPLSVLASVSRVKSAQFWPSSLASSKPVVVSTHK